MAQFHQEYQQVSDQQQNTGHDMISPTQTNHSPLVRYIVQRIFPLCLLNCSLLSQEPFANGIISEETGSNAKATREKAAFHTKKPTSEKKSILNSLTITTSLIESINAGRVLVHSLLTAIESIYKVL